MNIKKIFSDIHTRRALSDNDVGYVHRLTHRLWREYHAGMRKTAFGKTLSLGVIRRMHGIMAAELKYRGIKHNSPLRLDEDYEPPERLHEPLLVDDVIWPSDNEPHKFVYQHHYVGYKAHGDMRILFDDVIKGFIITEAVSNKIVQPVTDLQTARRLDTDSNIWKINWDAPHSRRYFCALREDESPDFLHLQGITDVGVLSIFDEGAVFLGAQKPTFKEMFFRGKYFHGRWVMSEIPAAKRTSQLSTWMFWKPKSQLPYVLSKEAVHLSWVPPYGASALPPYFQKLLSASFKYWNVDNLNQRVEIRDYLVTKLEQLVEDAYSMRRKRNGKRNNGPAKN